MIAFAAFPLAVAAGAAIAGAAVLLAMRAARRPFTRAARAQEELGRRVKRHRPTRDNPAQPMPRRNPYLFGEPAVTVRLPFLRSTP